jgi:hypothetical protein
VGLPEGWQAGVYLFAGLVIIAIPFLFTGFLLKPVAAKFFKKTKISESIWLQNKKLKPLLLLVLAGFVFVLGVLIYQNYFKNQESSPKNPQIEKERVGPRGDFQVNLTRKDDKIVLSWDKKIQVGRVLLVSLGKDTTDDDNIPVWGISTENPAPINISQEEYERALQSTEKPPEPVLITSPYVLLSKPDGFYYEGNIKGDQSKFKFEKGARYAVELEGVKDKDPVSAAYVFDY